MDMDEEIKKKLRQEQQDLYMDNFYTSYPTVDRYIEAYGGELVIH